MNTLLPLFALISGLLVREGGRALDLTNVGSTRYGQAGTSLCMGTGGLRNQARGTLTNAGTLDLSTSLLEVRGDFANAGTLTPGTSAAISSGTADQLLTPGGATLYQVLVSKPTSGATTLRRATSVFNQVPLAPVLMEALKEHQALPTPGYPL